MIKGLVIMEFYENAHPVTVRFLSTDTVVANTDRVSHTPQQTLISHYKPPCLNCLFIQRNGSNFTANGQLCDTYYLEVINATNRLCFVNKSLRRVSNKPSNLFDVYDCRNNTPFSDLYDRTAALKDNTVCYATRVVH